MPIFSNDQEHSMTYAGYYGMNNVNMSSGGGSIVEDGTISLYGNVWKSFELPIPYDATGNTYIEFKAKLITEGEGHAICAEDNLNADSYGGFHRRCIVFAGTQFDEWNDNHVLKIEKIEEGTTLIKKVLIGNLFPEVGTQIRYISFVQDNDALPAQGSSKFWDIRLSDITPVSLGFLYYYCILKKFSKSKPSLSVSSLPQPDSCLGCHSSTITSPGST